MVTTAPLANNPPTVPGWNCSFAPTPRTYLAGFHVEDSSSMRALIVFFMIDELFAFFAIPGLAEYPGDRVCLIVLAIYDEFPLRADEILCHALPGGIGRWTIWLGSKVASNP